MANVLLGDTPVNASFADVDTTIVAPVYTGNMMDDVGNIMTQSIMVHQQQLDGIMTQINLESQYANAYTQFSSDINNAITGAKSTTTDITISSADFSELQSFAEAHGLTVDGESFDTWCSTNKIANGSSGVTISQTNAGDLVAGLKTGAATASDASQNETVSMQQQISVTQAFQSGLSAEINTCVETLNAITRNF